MLREETPERLLASLAPNMETTGSCVRRKHQPELAIPDARTLKDIIMENIPETSAATGAKLNGYICFYLQQRWETHAPTQWAATVAARAHFKPPKSKMHLVQAHLAEKGGEPYVHTADF
jgi:hypothetical protein